MKKGKGKGKKPLTLEDKVRALDESFADSVNTMTEVQLKDRLVDLTNEKVRIDAAKTRDDDLKRLQQEVKEANKTYSEPLNGIKLKTKLLIKILQGRGKLPSDDGVVIE